MELSNRTTKRLPQNTYIEFVYLLIHAVENLYLMARIIPTIIIFSFELVHYISIKIVL